MNNSIEQLALFISENELRKSNGLIVFDAGIYFAKDGKLQHFDSQVQVVTLPTQMAVYITEFFRVEHQQKEIYKTYDCDFIFMGGNVLQVWLGHSLMLTVIVK